MSGAVETNLQLKGTDRAEFWAYTVVFGYQGLLLEDGDNNEEAALCGITRKSLGGLLHAFSVVYMEGIREKELGRLQAAIFTVPGAQQGLRNAYLEGMYATVGHEIAHAPGGQSESTDHDEKGMMAKGLETGNRQPFTPRTIARLRSTTIWTQ